MEIRNIQDNDIKDVIEVHKIAFKDFFLTQLGDHFLKVYYSSVKDDDKGLLVGLFDDGKLLGFCAATSLSRGFNKRIVKRNFLRFFMVGLRLLLIKPGSIVQLCENFSKRDQNANDDGNYAELLSISVLPESQNHGVGKKLMQTLEKRIKEQDVVCLSLTTDYYNNDNAIAFYKGLGFGILYEFMAYPKRKMFRMIKDLHE